MATIKKKVKDTLRRIQFISDRKRLENTNFTIISNNCWGGNVSRDLNVEHHSPFVGLYIYTDDYLKICSNLEYYLNQELIFIDIPIHGEPRPFPIGRLDDVEIFFQHYSSEEEARLKWSRRLKRVNWDNLFFKLDENYGATPEDLKKFDNLPYDRIVIMTKNEYPELKNAVHFKDFSLKSRMERYTRYFDIVEWLNTGDVIKK